MSATSLSFNYKINYFVDSSVTFIVTNTGFNVGGVIAVVTTINVVPECSVMNDIILNNETISCFWTPDSISTGRYTSFVVSSSIVGISGTVTLSATSLTFSYKITATSETDSAVSNFRIIHTGAGGGEIAVEGTIKVVTGCNVPNTVILNNETITCSWTPDSITAGRYTGLAASSSTIQGTAGNVTLSANYVTFNFQIFARSAKDSSITDFLITNSEDRVGGGYRSFVDYKSCHRVLCPKYCYFKQ